MTGVAPLRLVPPLPTPVSAQPEQTSRYSVPDVRIRFRQHGTLGGFVDAAWWPRSEILDRELLDLLDVLWLAGRNIRRVTYNLGRWGQLPRRINVGDHAVRLGAFRTGNPHLIRMTDSRGQESINMLIIPPAAEPRYAKRLMQLATELGEARSVDDMMAAASQDPFPHVGS